MTPVTLTRSRLGLGERLEALDQVLALAEGRLDPAAVESARRVAGKAGQRLRFGEGHTVVALAGATGSGKSSLFNTLTGEELSQVGLRRPTTGSAHAAVWGEPAGTLLDWLQVPRRHVLGERPEQALHGLVLLDLPDVDSVEPKNRIEAERLVEQVDLLVWVLDPQKYADHAVHDRYLAPLAGHSDVMLVVLNQVDRLPEAARAGCLADLRRLLASEGLADVPVLATSVRTGEGLDALRGELTTRVAAKRASVRRLEADLVGVAGSLDGVCGDGKAAGVGKPERQRLVDALSEAAGADLVTDAVASAYRLRAGLSTGWPFTRWISRFRLDPARRLRLRDNPSELVRTSLPGASAVQRARVDSALRELGDRAAGGLPDHWHLAVRRAAGEARPQLPDLLDRAVAGTDLGLARKPGWWRLLGALQILLALVAVAGFVWLAALFVVAWLQLPDPPMYHVRRIPVPTLMLGAGLLLGVLVSIAGGLFARVGATRAARRARRRLGERVEQLAKDAVVAPVERELSARTELCRALARVRG